MTQQKSSRSTPATGAPPGKTRGAAAKRQRELTAAWLSLSAGVLVMALGCAAMRRRVSSRPAQSIRIAWAPSSPTTAERDACAAHSTIAPGRFPKGPRPVRSSSTQIRSAGRAGSARSAMGSSEERRGGGEGNGPEADLSIDCAPKRCASNQWRLGTAAACINSKPRRSPRANTSSAYPKRSISARARSLPRSSAGTWWRAPRS
jgi:hypothetical protein